MRGRGLRALVVFHRVALGSGLVVVAACGSGGDGLATGSQVAITDAAVATDASGLDLSVSAFCAGWEEALVEGEDGVMSALLADPPASIAAEAAVVQQADESGVQTSESEEAGLKVWAWIELACNPAAAMAGAGPADRRVLPPLAVTAPDFEVCLASSALSGLGGGDGGAVLYGDASVDDPFAGEMVGVMWGTEGSAAGDGDTTPVTVRGVDGLAAPFTVFQQVVLDELGTVIAWEEEGFFVGLFGRGFDAGRVPELLEFAEALTFDDGAFELPADALPPGFSVVYDGSVNTMSLVVPVGSTYDVLYRQTDGDGLVSVRGYAMTTEEFDAFRFLALTLTREDIGGRDALVGNAWNESGPAVVTWRDPDGFAVRLVGTGEDLLAQVRDLAVAAEELDRDDWAAIVNATVPCFSPRRPSLTE